MIFFGQELQVQLIVHVSHKPYHLRFCTQGVVRESRISILGSYHPSQVITCSVNTTKKGTYFGSYTNQPKNNACI